MLQIKHKFTSPRADGADATKVQPSNWNDDHDFIGTVGVNQGGTGLTALPTNGQLLIGNGVDYTLATITAGSGIVVTNAPGAITVALDPLSSYVTSVNASGGTTGLTFSGGPITGAGTLTLGGTLAIANGGTGATTASAARTALGATATGDALFTAASAAAAKTTLSLNNVDNTSDANKPVSTATQTALNLKANIASPSFTGSVIVNGSTASGQFNVRAASGVSAIVLDNPSGTETLSFSSRTVAGFSTGYAANATLSLGTTTANTLQFVTSNTIRYTISAAGIHSVNGAGTGAVFNVRAVTGDAAIAMDNPSGSEQLRLTSRLTAGVAQVAAHNAGLNVATAGAQDVQFITNSVTRYRIASDGLHYVNTASSGGVFNVRTYGSDAALSLQQLETNKYINFSPNDANGNATIFASNAPMWIGTAGGSGGLIFSTNGNYRGSISADGLEVIFTGVANYVAGGAANVYVNPSTGRLSQVTSSRVFKKDIAAYVPGGNIDDLAPVFYRVINEGDGPTYAGLIAEEVHAAGFPEFVAYNGEGQPHSVYYPNMVALLVYEMKQDRAKLAQVMADLQDARDRIAQLEAAT